MFSSQIRRMVQVDSKRFINCQHLSVSSAPVALFSLRDNVKLIVITKPFIYQSSAISLQTIRDVDFFERKKITQTTEVYSAYSVDKSSSLLMQKKFVILKTIVLAWKM